MAQVFTPETDDEFDSILKVVSQDSFIALNFHTPWAQPCTQMNLTFNAIAATQPASSTFISIDAEKLPDTSEKYEVAAVPFFVLKKGEQTLSTISGADPKELRDKIERYSSSGGTGVAAATIPPAQKTATTSISTAEAATTNGEEEVEEEPLNERLKKLLSAAPVMLFMKGTPAAPQCGFSRQMVGLLRERGVRYGFFNILADDEVRQGLKEYSNWPTYPQLYVGGELVGGLDIVSSPNVVICSR